MYLQEIKNLSKGIIGKKLCSLSNLKVYLVKDFSTKILKNMVDFEIGMFGDLGMDEWGLVPQVRHGNVYMLRQDGCDEIIGLAILMRDWNDLDKVYLFDYAIAEAYQGLGFGYHFLVAICSHLKKQNIKKMSLTVDTNNKPAIRLYKDKIGFEIVKLSEEEYGEGHERYIMDLDLSKVPESVISNEYNN